MRSILITAMGLALGVAALAQAPPKNAIDITHLPVTTAQSASAASTVPAVAPSGIIRVYIGSLSGADATPIQGLITQALFESKKVVITENQGSANFILQGQVLRRTPPAPIAATTTNGKTKRRSRRKAAASDTTDPSVIHDLQALNQSGEVTDLDNFTAANDGSSLNAAGLTSLSMDLGNRQEDLSRYQFRLYLQLVSPDGDLIWMSGEGSQAPAFSPAGDAVNATVQPMLSAIANLPKTDTTPQL
ncbi:MAG: hypothetical protein ACRD1F_06045 [Terriglobales bacterium]